MNDAVGWTLSWPDFKDTAGANEAAAVRGFVASTIAMMLEMRHHGMRCETRPDGSMPLDTSPDPGCGGCTHRAGLCSTCWTLCAGRTRFCLYLSKWALKLFSGTSSSFEFLRALINQGMSTGGAHRYSEAAVVYTSQSHRVVIFVLQNFPHHYSVHGKPPVGNWQRQTRCAVSVANWVASLQLFSCQALICSFGGKTVLSFRLRLH